MENEIRKNVEAYPVLYKTFLHIEEHSVFYKNIFAASASIPIDFLIAERVCAECNVLIYIVGKITANTILNECSY